MEEGPEIFETHFYNSGNELSDGEQQNIMHAALEKMESKTNHYLRTLKKMDEDIEEKKKEFEDEENDTAKMLTEREIQKLEARKKAFEFVSKKMEDIINGEISYHKGIKGNEKAEDLAEILSKIEDPQVEFEQKNIELFDTVGEKINEKMHERAKLDFELKNETEDGANIALIRNRLKILNEEITSLGKEWLSLSNRIFNAEDN